MENLMQGNILLALAAALLWGGGDFSGGMGVKSVGGTVGGALRIVLFSHLSSLVVLLTIASVQGGPLPRGAGLAWGIGAGITGGLSLTIFYIALSRGAMGASAAISGLLAAAIPAAVSITEEGSPGVLRLFGFLIAGASIWMIAAAPKAPGASQGKGTLGLAIAAGAGFGIYFVALKMAGAGGPVWTMASARLGSISTSALMLAGITLRKGSWKVTVTGTAIRWILLTALMDTSGNLLFVAATRAGRLDVASVLASLYPATTILLAAWTLHEKPTRRQAFGMVVAATAVVMITL